MEQLVSLTLSEQLRDRIEECIVSGLFSPGTRLEETDLATRFNVSRTPIREALIQLSVTGLVEMRPRRGVFVSELSPERMEEMFDVMAEVEAICAKRAAVRATEQDRTAIREAHLACEEALQSSDPDAYYRRNEQFHMAIYRASQNDFLAEHAAALHRRLHPYRRLQLRTPRRMAASFAEHQSVLDAILSKDSEAAAQAIDAHVREQSLEYAQLHKLSLSAHAQ